MKNQIGSEAVITEGLREQKRRDTYQRIAEAGLRLFLAHGYDTTTLGMIAEEVGIARRTFFAYFKSKDEILLAWNRSSWGAFLDEVRKTTPDDAPLQAVRAVLERGMARTDDAQLKAIARLMRSNATLSAAQHASFAERERSLHRALCDVWRQPERRMSLRLVAMIAVGALRVAVENWERDDDTEPLRQRFREAFDGLERLLSRSI